MVAQLKRDSKSIIEEILFGIDIPEYYITLERNLRKLKQSEELAIELGVEPDKYYTAVQKEIYENDLNLAFGEVRGSGVG